LAEPASFPWDGLEIVVKTILVIGGFVALAVNVAQWVVAARDELRDRYMRRAWTPASVDICALPIWLALEAICLIAGLAFALISAFVVYQAAKEFRDWWHEGDQRSGR